MTLPGPTLSPDALRILEAQLTRMRDMLYRYYGLFFRFVSGGLVAHFTIARAAFFVVGTLIANITVARIGEPWSTFYVPVVIGWALLNGAYLGWYFIVRRDQRAIEAVLADAYEPRQSDAA